LEGGSATAVAASQSDEAEKADGKDGENKEETEDGKDKVVENTEKPPELPIEVRSKLRRLDKIEARYNGMTPRTCLIYYAHC
jgi:hypothetical protein